VVGDEVWIGWQGEEDKEGEAIAIASSLTCSPAQPSPAHFGPNSYVFPLPLRASFLLPCLLVPWIIWNPTKMAPCLMWRLHRRTALRSLLLLALLHRLNCLAFLAACAPVLLLTAFLLGILLVHSDDDHVASAEEEEEEEVDRHHHNISSSSSPSSSYSSEQDEEVVAEQEGGNKAPVAWTAEDERSIQSIGSLELERDARLEKLIMSRRSNSLHLDVRIPRGGHSYDKGDPGSAPSSLLQLRHPADDDHHHHHARPSRFRPYFVTADHYFDNSIKNKKSTSPSSSSSAAASDDHQQEQAEEAPAVPCNKQCDGMAVNVELISDSSDDDDVSLLPPPGARDHTDDEEEDSFEVASITQQVAAGAPSPKLIILLFLTHNNS
jgi:hypothetical protein